jgi:hypothetical protein
MLVNNDHHSMETKETLIENKSFDITSFVLSVFAITLTPQHLCSCSHPLLNSRITQNQFTQEKIA